MNHTYLGASTSSFSQVPVSTPEEILFVSAIAANPAAAFQTSAHTSRTKESIPKDQLRIHTTNVSSKKKNNRFLRGRQIAYMIYEHFRVTGTNESILDFCDLMSVTLREDDVPGFDIKWDEILLTVWDTPKDDILERMYRQKIRDSEKLKTTFAQYNRDTVQKKESPSNTRLKYMFKTYLQETKDRNFDVRNDSAANAATIWRKSEDRNC